MESRSIQIRFDREHRVEMAKVNLGTDISPKKLNVFAQITAETVIWPSNRARPFLSIEAIEPWAMACRLWHEVVSHGPNQDRSCVWGIP
jgi:hypothetical protein